MLYTNPDLCFFHQPVGERNDSQERKRRRKSSFEKLPSLHLFDWSSSSGQGQKVEVQITVATGERRAEGKSDNHLTMCTSFLFALCIMKPNHFKLDMSIH